VVATCSSPDRNPHEAARFLIHERLHDLLRGTGSAPRRAGPGLAHRLRDLLNSPVVDGISLDEAAAVLYADATHLVRPCGSPCSRRFPILATNHNKQL
jgi:hypothetical protein